MNDKNKYNRVSQLNAFVSAICTIVKWLETAELFQNNLLVPLPANPQHLVMQSIARPMQRKEIHTKRATSNITYTEMHTYTSVHIAYTRSRGAYKLATVGLRVFFVFI